MGMFKVRREVDLPWKHRKGGAQGHIFLDSPLKRSPAERVPRTLGKSGSRGKSTPAWLFLCSCWLITEQPLIVWILMWLDHNWQRRLSDIWSSWSLPYYKLLNQHSDFINPHLESFVSMSQPPRLINPGILGPKMVSQGPILDLGVFIKVNAVFYSEAYSCQPCPGNTPHAFLWIPFFGSGNRNYSEYWKQERMWLRELGLFKSGKGLRIRFQAGLSGVIHRNTELIHHGNYFSETVTVAIEQKATMQLMASNAPKIGEGHPTLESGFEVRSRMYA